MLRKVHRPTDSEYFPERGKRLWWYLTDQTFIVGGKAYTVPAGYLFDGSTVPGVLEGLFSPTGVTFHAGALHDFLYDTKGKGLRGEYNLTRRQVDRIFYLHMLAENTPRVQARIMHAGVRTFIGAGYWRRESFPTELLEYH